MLNALTTRPTPRSISPCAFPVRRADALSGRPGSRALARFLSGLRLGPAFAPLPHAPLALWPLVRRAAVSARAPTRLTLGRALEDGFVSLEVCGDAAVARRVRVGNRAPDPVLVLFGEDLRCGEVPLAASASYLVAPKSELEISVHAPGRPTRGGDARTLSRAAPALPGQVGFVAALRGAVVGLEALAEPEHFSRYRFALLRVYATGAPPAGPPPGSAEPPGGPRFEAPGPFLAALARSCVLTAESPGLGSDLRILGAGVAGCALESGGIVHVTAFPDYVD